MKKTTLCLLWLPILLAGVFGGAWLAWWNTPRQSSAATVTLATTEPPRHDEASPVLGRVVRDGIQVECRITPLDPPTSRPFGALREGETVRFEFTISDTTGKTPLTRVYPSAWVVSHPEDAPPLTPKGTLRLAERLLNGNLFTPLELDLNVYHVLTLNHGPTISVVDPRFGYGGSQLLALVSLASAGADWAIGPDGRQIFVTIPETNHVAIVDTQSWKVTANVPGGIRPRRLALQPDGRYLWVAGGAGDHTDSGVTVLDTADGKVVSRIRTGRGYHDLALSDDSRHAFVTNSIDGSVSVISVGMLREVANLTTGHRPASIAFCPRAHLAYVTDAQDGTICSIDPEAPRVINRIAAEPGLGAIRFSPTGEAGFVINPERSRLYVIDPTSNRIVQKTQVEQGPDQIAFSSDFAYIRHRGSINIVMISLKTAGKEGVPLSLTRFPAGEGSPGAMQDATAADSIIPAPGANAMLVANPKDKTVYYYKEGLAAPMGNFSNYKREPRAVLVLDQGLRERTRPGTYETVGRLGRAGKFDLVFFLDQPRIVHAFSFEVQPDPMVQLAHKLGKVSIQSLVLLPRSEAGKTFRPLFQLTDQEKGTLKAGLTDVQLLMYRVDSGWQDRRTAQEVATGIYGADFVPDLPGVYEVFVSCESVGVSARMPQKLLTLRVVEAVETPSRSGAQNKRTDRRTVASDTAGGTR